MEGVVMAGVGMTRFGKLPDRTPRSLVAEAVAEALDDAGLTGAEVGGVYVANAFGGTLLGQESVRGQVWLSGGPLEGLPTVNVENACAGGGTALALAATAIVAGQTEIAVAVGVEKLTTEERGRAVAAMEGAMDQERLPQLRRSLGVPEGVSPFMRIYAGFAERYLAASDATPRDFALVASKTHGHGVRNPRAQYRTPFTVEEVLEARTIAGPLTLPMCAPLGDGAAAVVLTAGSVRHGDGPPPVRVLAAAVGAGRVGAYGELVPGTAHRAYEQAGVGPEDVDVLEIHDAASPAELIALEELGIAEPSEAVAMVRAGVTTIGGRLPVNPSGGLVSRGHPLGATGLAQVVELADQLRGRAGDRQVADVRIALAENAGGFLDPDAAAAAITILAT